MVLVDRIVNSAYLYPREAVILFLTAVIFWLWRRKECKAKQSFGDESPFYESETADDGPDENAPNDGEQVDMISYQPVQYTTEEMCQRSQEFYEEMNGRRSVRYFRDKPVPISVVQNIVKTAGTAPSGAHTEPWTFAVVSSAEAKAELRRIVEAEEEINYRQRMGEEWVADLAHFRVNWVKPYIQLAPHVIVVFRQVHGQWPDGRKRKHYYSEISVGIATGLLLAAVQHAGLVTLTSTPLNAGPQIRQLLGRPENEKVMLLLPLGYPSPDCNVPDLKRKKCSDIMVQR